MTRFVLLCLLALISTAAAKGKGFGPGEQDYGYADVRDGAHMFWWLFHTTANVTNSSERPLMMWLQGGPGASSCGYGNFEILGPLDLNLEPRESTWVKDFNVLFVDNPVGSGYSYVDRLSSLTTDNKQIARDLVSLMKSFYEKLPQFKTTPFYVYGQSYGGKMAIEFARMLYDEVAQGNIQSNISGVAMGNSWISPVDSTLSWGPLLYEMSLVDEGGLEAINRQANYTKQVFDQGQFAQSTSEWARTQNVVFQKTDGVDFYNVINKVERGFLRSGRTIMEKAFDVQTITKHYSSRADSLDTLMNGPVKEALGIPSNVRWGSQSNSVFNYLNVDFMKPVTSVVESLLNETNINVHVYNGNVDLICSTPGQMVWINKLKSEATTIFQTALRRTIWVNNTMEGYEKHGGKFALFWINVAGHSAPIENTAATRHILKSMTGF
ncbi:retinoid-inducible serine carboxypeptidase-like isoform X1 [Arctopsyche grandis]|uniref:retinoid-inducible serine carboxypeptidase-like isoform X1 n=1 Tax=Arctopsyche grandis TaxID=121162 RepID=UPI00406D985F